MLVVIFLGDNGKSGRGEEEADQWRRQRRQGWAAADAESPSGRTEVPVEI